MLSRQLMAPRINLNMLIFVLLMERTVVLTHLGRVLRVWGDVLQAAVVVPHQQSLSVLVTVKTVKCPILSWMETMVLSPMVRRCVLMEISRFPSLRDLLALLLISGTDQYLVLTDWTYVLDTLPLARAYTVACLLSFDSSPPCSVPAGILYLLLLLLPLHLACVIVRAKIGKHTDTSLHSPWVQVDGRYIGSGILPTYHVYCFTHKARWVLLCLLY